MTIEEAIKHAEEKAKENELDAEEYNRISHDETHPMRDVCANVYVKCKKCAEDHRQLARWLKELKYARVLLKATCDLLKQCDDSYFVLNALEQLVTYDGVACDGYCLMEDIEAFMEEWDDN